MITLETPDTNNTNNNERTAIHYLHLRNKVFYRKQFLELSAKGGATVAYQTGTVMFDGIDYVVIKGAVAICHYKDNYCKATGRSNAVKRLRGDFTYPRKGDVNKSFLVEVGRVDDLDYRIVNDTIEVLHDNKMMRDLISKQAMEIIVLTNASFLQSYDPNSEVKLQLV
jgi:hypothetical protein